jgi:hypothetical protein
MSYIAPAYKTEFLANDWEAYLAKHCDWSEDDFGGGYAWECPVPPRDQWKQEIDKLNHHLASLSGKKPYDFQGHEMLHGRSTENYQCTRVNGRWYYHPSDTGWLSINFNTDFSDAFSTEKEALEAAKEQEEIDA